MKQLVVVLLAWLAVRPASSQTSQLFMDNTTTCNSAPFRVNSLEVYSHNRSARPHYRNNRYCVLVVHSDRPASYFLIKFYFFNLAARSASQCDDSLHLFDGPFEYKNPFQETNGLGGLCGTQAPMKVFSSSGSSVVIRFSSDNKPPRGDGFHLALTSYSNPLEDGSCPVDSFRCLGRPVCIPAKLVCDGFDNCFDSGSDEGIWDGPSLTEDGVDARRILPNCLAKDGQSNTSPVGDETILDKFLSLGIAASIAISVGSFILFVVCMSVTICVCCRLFGSKRDGNGRPMTGGPSNQMMAGVQKPPLMGTPLTAGAGPLPLLAGARPTTAAPSTASTALQSSVGCVSSPRDSCQVRRTDSWTGSSGVNRTCGVVGQLTNCAPGTAATVCTCARCMGSAGGDCASSMASGPAVSAYSYPEVVKHAYWHHQRRAHGGGNTYVPLGVIGYPAVSSAGPVQPIAAYGHHHHHHFNYCSPAAGCPCPTTVGAGIVHGTHLHASTQSVPPSPARMAPAVPITGHHPHNHSSYGCGPPITAGAHPPPPPAPPPLAPPSYSPVTPKRSSSSRRHRDGHGHPTSTPLEGELSQGANLRTTDGTDETSKVDQPRADTSLSSTGLAHFGYNNLANQNSLSGSQQTRITRTQPLRNCVPPAAVDCPTGLPNGMTSGDNLSDQTTASGAQKRTRKRSRSRPVKASPKRADLHAGVELALSPQLPDLSDQLKQLLTDEPPATAHRPTAQDQQLSVTSQPLLSTVQPDN